MRKCTVTISKYSFYTGCPRRDVPDFERVYLMKVHN